jgi:hypothetical protein
MRAALEPPRGRLWGVSTVWRDCAPFVENGRAILIHRPRSVVTYNIHAAPHIGVNYWCGNQVSTSGKITFLSEPPHDRLLCEACEARAVMAGHPTATEIVGRHVHIGRLKAIRMCCPQPAGDRHE